MRGGGNRAPQKINKNPTIQRKIRNREVSKEREREKNPIILEGV